MKDSHSPEERLLKLIRKEKKPEGKAAQPSGPAGAGLPKPEIKNAAYSSLLNFLTMRLLYRGMVVAAAASFLYLAAAFVYPWVGLKKIRLPVIPEQGQQD